MENEKIHGSMVCFYIFVEKSLLGPNIRVKEPGTKHYVLNGERSGSHAKSVSKHVSM